MSEITGKRLDGTMRRKSRVDKERKEKKKVRIMAVSITSALVLIFAGALFVNSNIIRRVMPAITIDGVNFSAAEYDYYFMASYNGFQNQYISMFGSYEAAKDYLPSNESALSSQIQNEETGETWADYFAQAAFQQMSGIAQLYNAATAAGYKLTPEDHEEITKQLNDQKEVAIETYGYPSFNEFLKKVYGGSVNENALRKITERIFITSNYSKQVYDSFEYSKDKLAEYYSENADTMDNFVFRQFLVSPPTDEETYETEEETDAAKEAALEVAKEQAAQIASGIESEDDFINAAKDYDETAYSDPESTFTEYPGSNVDYMDYAEWLRDSARQFGNVITSDSDYGTYLVFFIRRDKNEYDTVNMRQILVLRSNVDPADFEEGEEDPDYYEAVQNAETDARTFANEALDKFTAGGATEEKLLELMPDYSDDTTEGGLYEKIMKGNMVSDIDDWLFATGRKYGDYQLIRTDDYGYHLVFFMGFSDKACDVSAENDLRSADYQTWKDGLPVGEAATRWAFNLTQKH